MAPLLLEGKALYVAHAIPCPSAPQAARRRLGDSVQKACSRHGSQMREGALEAGKRGLSLGDKWRRPTGTASVAPEGPGVWRPGAASALLVWRLPSRPGSGFLRWCLERKIKRLVLLARLHCRGVACGKPALITECGYLHGRACVRVSARVLGRGLDAEEGDV